MSLSVKRLALLFSFALSIVITACEDPKEIGLPQDHSLGVFFTDTLTVKTSTVLVDSVIAFKVVPTTNGSVSIGSSYLLAGQYTSPDLGTVTAKSFFRPRYNDNSTFNAGTSPTLDSLVLFLAYRYSYGDTNAVNTVYVHQLADSIQRNRTYYNFEQIVVEPSPVGSASFLPAPNRGDTLRIPLSPSLGNQLLSLSGQSASDFIKSFYGLALVPQSGSDAAVVGFSLARSFMRLYYKSEGAAKTYDFSFNGIYCFNNVQSNRQGTPLASLQQPSDSVAASEFNNQTAIQAGVGLMTKIEIPHLMDLQKDGNIAVNKVELVVSPTDANLPSILQQLALYPTTSTGAILRDPLTGSPYSIRLDYLSSYPLANLKNNSSYSFNLTAYIQGILRGTYDNNGLILSAPSSAMNISAGTPPISLNNSLEDSVTPVIIGSQQHPAQPLKLKIYYTPVGAN